MIFKILWGIDALTALVFVVFFIIGIGDGTVSSFNIMLWLLILGILAAVLIGSISLQRVGRRSSSSSSSSSASATAPYRRSTSCCAFSPLGSSPQHDVERRYG